MGLILNECIYSVYILNIIFIIDLEDFMCAFGVTYNFIIICNLFGMFYYEGIIVMFVVNVVVKKKWDG